MAVRRHEFLEQFVARAEIVMKDHDLPASMATAVANALADYLTEEWGGQVIGIPKDYRWRLDQLELQILDAFTGDNYDELAREHNMTMSGVRKLIRRVRAKLRQNANQGGLFDPPGAA